MKQKRRCPICLLRRWEKTSGTRNGRVDCISHFDKPAAIPCIAAPAKLHVRARLFEFARKFNSDLCMAAPYVQVRAKRRLRCPDQPDPRPHPNPITLTLTLTLTQPFGGLEVCSRGRQGAVLSLHANMNTLHVRAYKRPVHVSCLCFFARNAPHA